MFSTAEECEANHRAPPSVLAQSLRSSSTETSFRIRSTSSGSTKPGESAKQFAVPQATARASASLSLCSLAYAIAKPASAASPHPTDDLTITGGGLETREVP